MKKKPKPKKDRKIGRKGKRKRGARKKTNYRKIMTRLREIKSELKKFPKRQRKNVYTLLFLN